MLPHILVTCCVLPATVTWPWQQIRGWQYKNFSTFYYLIPPLMLSKNLGELELWFSAAQLTLHMSCTRCKLSLFCLFRAIHSTKSENYGTFTPSTASARNHRRGDKTRKQSTREPNFAVPLFSFLVPPLSFCFLRSKCRLGQGHFFGSGGRRLPAGRQAN